MKCRLMALLLMLCALSVTGCSGDKKGSELLETARFEEKQNNREHALKLYNEIVQKYPGTPSAAAAAARLNQLQQQK